MAFVDRLVYHLKGADAASTDRHRLLTRDATGPHPH